MDQFSAMHTFRRVVDLGSFSAAANQAGRQVARLLQGEAYFQVPEGAQLPLEVEAGPLRAQVRDTDFAVRYLDGEAQVAIPSLRFSRRYTAPDWTLDGELLFSGRVRGTLRSPELVGALRGEHLMLFNRSLGWRLREGRIEARFDGRELTIDTIRFAGGDGSMTISGALRARSSAR